MYMFWEIQLNNVLHIHINIKKTQRRQYEGHNTSLGHDTDQGPWAAVSMMAKGSIVT